MYMYMYVSIHNIHVHVHVCIIMLTYKTTYHACTITCIYMYMYMYLHHTQYADGQYTCSISLKWALECCGRFNVTTLIVTVFKGGNSIVSLP